MNFKVIKNFAMILAPTYRSKAYLQSMIHCKLLPEAVYIIKSEYEKRKIRKPKNYKFKKNKHIFKFLPNKKIEKSLDEVNINYSFLKSKDINSLKNIQILKKSHIRYFIYSGLPKIILKKPILSIGKNFLHIHGGYLPKYHGATAFYHGMLVNGKIGQTAFWMSNLIDSGKVLKRRWYPYYGENDIDNVVDPLTRADLLIEILNEYVKKKKFKTYKFYENTNYYYIIHPILKKIAIDNFKKNN